MVVGRRLWGIWRAAALGAGLSLVAGCPQKPTKPTPTLTFQFPTDGQTLHATDSLPGAPAGAILLTVKVAAKNVSVGSAVTLTVDGTAAGPSTIGADGTASVAGVVLTGSAAGTPHTLQASVVDSGGNGNAQATAHATVILPPAACSVTGIAPGDGAIFNETGATVAGQPTFQDEDLGKPGMQAKIVATTSCPDGSSATLFAGPQQLATGSVSGGQAVFDQVNLPDTDIRALSQPALRLQITVAVASGGGTSTQSVGYIVDSAEPTATILVPTDGTTFTEANDADSSTPGLQVVVSGVTEGFNQLSVGMGATFSIGGTADGKNPYPVDPVSGSSTLKSDGTFSTEVTLVNGVAVPLIFYATTATGNVVTSKVVTVSVSATPTVSINDPTAGQLLTASSNLNPGQPGLHYEAHVSTTAASGAEIVLCSTVAPPGGPPTACPLTCAGAGGSAFEVGSGAAAGAQTILPNVVLGDGDQTLVAGVTDSGGSACSTGVAVSVHATRPAVTGIAFAPAFVDSDGGTWLNAANLPPDGGPATSVAQVRLDPSDSFVLPDGGGTLVTLANAQTHQTIATAPVGQGDAGPEADIPVALADGPYALQATVSDVWDNASDPKAPAANVGLIVKTSEPSCTLTGPATSYWNVADNDGGQGGDVTLPVTLTASGATALDVAGASLPGSATVLVDGASATTVPAAGSLVVAPASAPQGADVLGATITDPAGNGPVACGPDGGLAITVATVAPTIAIAAGTPDGRALPVTITTTEAQAGQPIQIFVNSLLWTTVPVDASGTTAATLLGLPKGTPSIFASVVDLAGNSATSATITATINALGCSLVISSPSQNPVYFNGTGAFGPASGGSLQAQITATTDCAGTAISLTNTPQGGNPATVQKTSDPTTGKAVFTLVLADGAQGQFSASITSAPAACGSPIPAGCTSVGGGQCSCVTSTAVVPYQTKLTAPTLSSTTPSATSLELVAFSGNPNVGQTVGGALVAANAADDTSAAHVAIAGSAAGLGPANGSGNLGSASLQLAFPGVSTTTTQPLSGPEPAAISFPDVHLPAHATGTVTLTVEDNAGNPSTAAVWNVATDVVPPAAPSPTAQIATAQDARTGTVTLSWTAPADDGTTASSGSVTSYDLRWSSTVDPANDSQFFGGGMNVDNGIASLSIQAPGQAQTYALAGLPPIATSFVALRAVDAVGNRSPLTVNTVANVWNNVVITGPSNSNLGYTMASGDFNGDGKVDLAIGGPNFSGGAGAAYVIYGVQDMSTVNAGSLVPLSNGTNADLMSYDLTVADFDGDGFDDLAVGSPTWNSSQGRVDIYFGSATGLPATPSVEIQGTVGAGGKFGRSVKAIGDVNKATNPTTSKPQATLFIGAPTEGNGTGYLFFGRTQALWKALGAPAPLLDSVADLALSGPAGSQFGFRWAAVGVGDLTGAGYGDFILPDSAQSTVYGFSGQAITALAGTGHTAAVVGNDTFVQSEGGACGSAAFEDCFGMAAVGGLSFTGGATPDVVVSAALSNEVYLFATSGGKMVSTPVTTLTGNGVFGWSLAGADINGDGLPDLLVGTNGSNTSQMLIFLNSGQSPFLPATPSSVVQGPLGSFFGYSLAAGSLNGTAWQSGAEKGKGLPDVAVGAAIAGTVTIYY